MTTYYLNAGSAVPTNPYTVVGTGAHSLYDLVMGVDPITLVDGDVIELVEGTVIDDSANYVTIPGSPSPSVTFQTYSGNEGRPIWNVGSMCDSLFDQPSYFRMYDIDILGFGPIFGSANSITSVNIERCSLEADFGIGDPGNTRIVNNIFNSQWAGLWFWGNPSDATVEINNNVFANSITYAIGLNNSMDTLGNCRILNNIFYKVKGDVYSNSTDSDSSNVLIDYNCSYQITEPSFNNVSASYLGSNNIFVDPLFKGPDSSDFTLDPTSPCADTGVDNAMQPSVPTEDFNGNSRPLGAHTDMGAFEIVGIPQVGTQSFFRGTATRTFFNGNLFDNPVVI